MPEIGMARRLTAAMISTGLALGGTLVATGVAEATVVTNFTPVYEKSVYGDFVQAGNGNMGCPTGADPVSLNSLSYTDCAPAQAGTAATGNNGRESHYMKYVDADGSGNVATYNSSIAKVNIPAGATIDYARLHWGGHTGVFRNATDATGNRGCAPGYTSAASTFPTGTPATAQVSMAIGAGTPLSIGPDLYTADDAATMVQNESQQYVASTDVKSLLAPAVTGSDVNLTVGNIWTPQGYGCLAGWSLTAVYVLPSPTGGAIKRSIQIKNGYVKQHASEGNYTTSLETLDGASKTTGSRLGVTSFGGHQNLTSDALSYKGTALTEPRLNNSTNFFASTATNQVTPSVVNNFSVDAKVAVPTNVAVGDRSGAVVVGSGSDTFVLSSLAMSVPTPGIYITATPRTNPPYYQGDTVIYDVVVGTSDGQTLTNVGVSNSDQAFGDCNRPSTTTLNSGSPTLSYSCTVTAGNANFNNTIQATGTNAFLEQVSDSKTITATVGTIGLSLTKTADKAVYTAGETINFTVTATNTGSTTLTNVAITDPKVTACAKNQATLAPGAQLVSTCSATAPIAGDQNTANVTATDVRGNPVNQSANANAVSEGSISGRVFADRDDNGAFDALGGDTNLVNVGITLTGTETNSGAPVNLNTSTAPDGTWSFANLKAGNYTVTKDPTPDYDPGKRTAGANATAPLNTETFTVALPGGQSSTGNLFAVIPTSSLSGFVYEDSNNNGVKDTGEKGIQGVAIALSGIDDGGNPANWNTATDVDGAYTFNALRQGNYNLSETQPEGWTDGKDTPGSAGGTRDAPDSIVNISLDPRVVAIDYLFGEYKGTSIAGKVVDDMDMGIAGVKLTVTGGAGPLETTTDAGGAFSFTLAPGTYTLTEEQPLGYAQGTDTVGTTGGTHSSENTFSNIVLRSGDAGTGYVFKEKRGSLTGYVYEDKNGNGNKDAAEPGIADVSVKLTGTDAMSRPVNTTMTTNSQGLYTFTGIVGGTYSLTETQPEGYENGVDRAGTVGGDYTPPDTISDIPFPAGADATGYLFGEYKFGSIYGEVLNDKGNPIANVKIMLENDERQPTGQMTMTDEFGQFFFENIVPGTYKLVEEQPAGYADGPDTAGTGGGDTSVADTIGLIPVGSGDILTGYQFTEKRGSLAGYVYEDTNNNGLKDTGEKGIQGAELTLTGTDAQGKAVNLTATTDVAGLYKIEFIVGGTGYTLSEKQPAGYVTGKNKVGSQGGTLTAPDKITGITFSAGAAATGYLFGELTPASLAGDVVNEKGEGIAGVTVVLTGTDDMSTTVNKSAVTTAGGKYAFNSLRPGTYNVTETQPDGYGQGSATPGSAGGTAVTTDEITGVVITSEAKATGYRFSEKRGSLSGVVFDDRDNDGVRDDGEPGIQGVTLTLKGNSEWCAVGEPDGTDTETDNGTGTPTPDTGTDPGTTDPGTDPGTTDPGTTDPGTDPGTTDPGTTDPGTTDPGTTDPGTGAGGTPDTGVDAGGTPDTGGGRVDPAVSVDEAAPTCAVELTATTDASGVFSFTGLVGGTYDLMETQPAAYADGKDSAGTAGGTVTAPDAIMGIVLAGGVDATGYLFGERAGVITGTVWVDANGDGTIDNTEMGRIAGAKVDLMEGDSTTPLASATTTAEGTYEFKDVPAGDYSLMLTLPMGYGATTPTTVKVTTTTTSGTNVDFGVQKAAIGDFVWDDLNRNGLQDAGEPGISGVKVNLLDAQGEVKSSTTTNASGKYVFGDLDEGAYRVQFTVPTGRTFTAQNAGAPDKSSAVDRSNGLSGPIVFMVAEGKVMQNMNIDAGVVDRITDLGVTLTADNPSPQVGSQVVITSKVVNTGTVPVNGAIATITIPQGLTINSVDGGAPQAQGMAMARAARADEGWTCAVNGQQVVCTTPDVIQPGGSSLPITITTTANSAFTTTNATALVTLADGTGDDNPANDGATTPALSTETPSTGGPNTGGGTTQQPMPPMPPNGMGNMPLAWTGSEIRPVLIGGLALLLAGLGTLFLGKRRRKQGM
ncbi:hypothetical protein CNX65_02900 [Actinosynnema pretiosum]|uniref:Gram-positive cocci surface proteins LPxTG domain-containing protein n=1 Tax=Actinosynnema pretiosum TaxID=42197 RepID=A0A290Z050_9PSEU|nr:hypothetical protein CNX65_02900 [Actinosynnema pretiosum]